MHGHIPNEGYYDFLFESADVITANTKYLAKKIENLNCPTNKLEIVTWHVSLGDLLSQIDSSLSIPICITNLYDDYDTSVI